MKKKKLQLLFEKYHYINNKKYGLKQKKVKNKNV